MAALNGDHHHNILKPFDRAAVRRHISLRRKGPAAERHPPPPTASSSTLAPTAEMEHLPQPLCSQGFSEGVLRSVKSLLKSRKDLCSVSTGEFFKGIDADHLIEITFLSLADEMNAAYIQELAGLFVELPDLLKSLHLYKLNDNEVIFLKGTKKPSQQADGPVHQDPQPNVCLTLEDTPSSRKDFWKAHNVRIFSKNQISRILCVMRASPTFPKVKVDSIFNLLSKYTTSVRYTVDLSSLRRLHTESSHADDDDTNQSVSSIEDDFVTAFEHLDEEEPPSREIHARGFDTTRVQRDVASQTVPAHCFRSSGSKILVGSSRRKSSTTSLINLFGLKERTTPVKNSVTTLVSDVWKQRSICKPSSTSDQGIPLLHKAVLSPSPAESSESDGSSPSPIIFLDEEGYQKSLKATLDLPKIPVAKDDIEDSDSEISEFFDSFDQFDDSDHCLENIYVFGEPTLNKSPQKRKFSKEKSSSTGMNPHRFKLDRPLLPANIRKPTPRKPESPFGAPDSPLAVKTSGDDTGALFSPIKSAFSPLGGGATTDCFNRQHGGAVEESISHHMCTTFAERMSFEILGSTLHSHSKMPQKRRQSVPCASLVISKENQEETVMCHCKGVDKMTDRTSQRKHRPHPIKGSIQKFATELVERSFGSAFKDLQKGVSSCTNALCHLASKLTSSVFQMAFYEIGRRHAFSLKARAISGLASFMVSEAVSSALSELQCVKKQVFTNTVARFAADLAEELVFEGIMEVCQFSQPSTPTTAKHWSFDCENKVVKSYARDLSESVIQEAFIELSQADVTFTTQAAISVSLDNIKYVSAESKLQSTQTCTVVPNFQDRALTSLNPPLEPEKEYTVQQALVLTSGVVSSISVPLAGHALSQHPTLFYSETKESAYPRDGRFGLCNNFADAVPSSIINHSCASEHSHIIDDPPRDFQPVNLGVSSCSELGIEPTRLAEFSGSMVDMIVNDAYEVITSSNLSKPVDDYTDYLTRKVVVKPPSDYQTPCMERSKMDFADQMARCILTQSVDAFTSTQTSGSKCGVSDERFLNGVQKPGSAKVRNVSTSMESQHIPQRFFMPMKPAGKDPHKRSVLKYCPEEHKGHVADVLSTFAPYLSITKCDEVDPNGEVSAIQCSPKPSKNVSKKLKGSSVFGPYCCSSELHCVSSSMFNSGESLQMESKTFSRDVRIGTSPDPPPPTPLAPSQISTERNLRKLTKKLKGELAKDFAPATPPSTPRNQPNTAHESQQKEEFMLKLVTSLSEEVESSEEEEQLEELSEKSENTAKYADNLANHIVSMATEMASFYLEDKSDPGEFNKKQSVLAVLNERWGYATCMKNITEETLRSLWLYAGDMAADVLQDAKKTAVTRHRKLLRLKKVNCGMDGLCRRRNSSDCRSSERSCGMADHWSRELGTSLLSLPFGSGSAGLTSRYPSCESVTDEYAGHVLQVLKREGANSELIMDQYASRLAYRSIKSGLQQAACKMKLKCNRRIFPVRNAQVGTAQDGHKLLNGDPRHFVETDRHARNGISCHFGDPPWESGDAMPRNECTDLLHFAESLAHSITCDVRRKLKMSTVCLPKSLTDSCLYKRSTVDDVAGDLLKNTFSRTLVPDPEKNKPYHSTGSLNEYGYSEGFIQAIEQYARKVVDDTLELSLSSLGLHVAENRKKANKTVCSEKVGSLFGSDCRYCNMKDHPSNRGASLYLPSQTPLCKIMRPIKCKHSSCGKKPRISHMDIPKIHIDPEQRAVFAEKIVTAAIEKAERELSNTSLAADSGIGHDAVSFAESLTTEIMTSAITNISQTFNICSLGKDGFQTGESAPNQPSSLSVGDDSTGSWSNLSFEDEHQDESSSFLHLSDSNGNSSSWSSLGLEGDLYEENVSFPPSDSDGTEEKDEDAKVALEGLSRKMLLIRNVDMESSTVDTQLRIALQWAVASQFGMSELRFQEPIKKEFSVLSKRLREKEWKAGDLLHAVLKYCEMMEKKFESERGPSKSLFSWLLENV